MSLPRTLEMISQEYYQSEGDEDASHHSHQQQQQGKDKNYGM